MNQHKNTDLKTGARATFCCLLATSVIWCETASPLVPEEPLACPCGHRAQEQQERLRGAPSISPSSGSSSSTAPCSGIVPSPVSPPACPNPCPQPWVGLRPWGRSIPDPSPWSPGLASHYPCSLPGLGDVSAGRRALPCCSGSLESPKDSLDRSFPPLHVAATVVHEAGTSRHRLRGLVAAVHCPPGYQRGQILLAPPCLLPGLAHPRAQLGQFNHKQVSPGAGSLGADPQPPLQFLQGVFINPAPLAPGAFSLFLFF